MKRIILLLGAGMFIGCAEGPSDSSQLAELGTTDEALTAAEKPMSPPSSSGQSSLSLRWSIGDGVIEQAPDAPLELWIENIEDEPIDGQVTIELIGLGVRRVVDLGQQTIAPKSKVRLEWSPAKSPIMPIGSTARIFARVAFERAGVGVAAPARALALAFSDDGRAAFLSATDDTGVRLASLGRAGASTERVAVSPEDRSVLLATLADWRGTVDGEAVRRSTQATPMMDAAEALGKKELFDTVELDDESAGEASASRDVTPNDIIIIPPPACDGAPVTMPICGHWDPTNFRDVLVYSSSVPYEDHTLSGPAAYANATITDGLNLAWEGRLDAAGCSPPVTFCKNRVGMNISAASLEVPFKMVGGFPLYGTREFLITPARSYSANIMYVYNSAFGTTTGLGVVSSVLPPMKVAAAASRILAMPDNGVRRDSFNYTAPALTIHAQDGCPSISYGSGQYGEACAVDNEAWFGMSLREIGRDANNNPIYEETGWHTTNDAYTIGHELGHSMQFAANGGPGTFDYTGISLAGMCSCSHVNDGNRIHCLQSRHGQDTAEVEGFGHFYAARVMNDQASTCRFTYYKNYRSITAWTTTPLWSNIAPPVPTNCGQPFVGFPGSSSPKQGWVPTFCAEANKSSENDWLTFLWAVNGSATTSQRSSMTDLFTILGGSGSGTGFTWTSVKNKADSHFGSTSTKAIRFRASGILHGVTL